MSARDAVLDAIAAKLRGVAGADIERVFDALVVVAGESLKARHEFVLPGIVKLQAVKRPAVRERRGVNPFTREEMVFPGKPAGVRIKARADASLARVFGQADDDSDDGDEG